MFVKCIMSIYTYIYDTQTHKYTQVHSLYVYRLDVCLSISKTKEI